MKIPTIAIHVKALFCISVCVCVHYTGGMGLKSNYDWLTCRICMCLVCRSFLHLTTANQMMKMVANLLVLVTISISIVNQHFTSRLCSHCTSCHSSSIHTTYLCLITNSSTGSR